MENRRLPKEQISYIRLPDADDLQNDIMLPAFVISATQAFAICDNQLELCVISPTRQSNVYERVALADPMFYVGNDEQVVFYDLTSMTFAEFAKKYMHMTLHEKCRHHLIEARWKHQLTVEEVAGRTGITVHDYLQIEHGLQSPSVDVAHSLSRLLGSSIEQLFFPQEVTVWLDEVK
ncbi:hypothetical protein CBW65_10010 [Tumebacillus avium]|uniref:HTH cro/C1-type domain-containing protein n=1 Tax=Tumebacillus avium TaxID=1903704 RepID=A0A1Y0ILA6_9BACL|nr:helix-turn-helix domain-containing protein [Tumebacillus avium]ARU61291.1 hypothetical protein CBW65_10010 [Tumebacillus avium]